MHLFTLIANCTYSAAITVTLISIANCYFTMAAILGRREIQIKKTGQTVTIPGDPIAKLMYYLDCVCSCVEADDDYSIRCLRDYSNYSRLSDEEEAKLLILCLALSPDKLIGTVFFPNDDLDCNNEFFELSSVNTKLVVAESLLIGGQQKSVRKIMMFKMAWIEKFYLDPLRPDQFDFLFHGPDRPKILGIKKKKKKEVWQCMAKL